MPTLDQKKTILGKEVRYVALVVESNRDKLVLWFPYPKEHHLRGNQRTVAWDSSSPGYGHVASDITSANPDTKARVGNWIVVSADRSTVLGEAGLSPIYSIPTHGTTVTVYDNSTFLKGIAANDPDMIAGVCTAWLTRALTDEGRKELSDRVDKRYHSLIDDGTSWMLSTLKRAGAISASEAIIPGTVYGKMPKIDEEDLQTQKENDKFSVEGNPSVVVECPPRLDSILYTKPGYTRIGYTEFVIPPESIEVAQQEAVGGMQVQLMRARGTAQRGMGHVRTAITMSMVFDCAETVQQTLIPLLEQCRRFPFLPVENELLNEEYDIDAIAIQSVSLSTVTNLSEAIRLTLVCQDFSWRSYQPQQITYDEYWNYPLFQVWCEQRSPFRVGGVIRDPKAKSISRPTKFQGMSAAGPEANGLAFEVLSEKDVEWEINRRREEAMKLGKRTNKLSGDELTEAIHSDYDIGAFLKKFVTLSESEKAIVAGSRMPSVDSSARGYSFPLSSKLCIYLDGDSGDYCALFRLSAPESFYPFLKAKTTRDLVGDGIVVYSGTVFMKSGSMGTQAHIPILRIEQSDRIDLRSANDVGVVESSINNDPRSVFTYVVRVRLSAKRKVGPVLFDRPDKALLPPEVENLASDKNRRQAEKKTNVTEKPSNSATVYDPLPTYDEEFGEFGADFVIEQLGGEFSNLFSELQVISDDSPTLQYLGGTRLAARIEGTFTDESLVGYIDDFSKRVRLLYRNVRGAVERNGRFYGIVKVKNTIINNILGIEYCVPVARVVQTAKGVPGVYRVLIDLIEHDPEGDDYGVIQDLLDKDYESGKTTASLEDAHEGIFDHAVRWETYRDRLALAELYPDLQLPRHTEVASWMKDIAGGNWSGVFDEGQVGIFKESMSRPKGTGYGFEDPDFFIANESKDYERLVRECIEEAIASDMDGRGDPQRLISNSGEEYTVRLLSEIEMKDGVPANTRVNDALKQNEIALARIPNIGAGKLGSKITIRPGEDIMPDYEYSLAKKYDLVSRQVKAQLDRMPNSKLAGKNDLVVGVYWCLLYTESRWRQFGSRSSNNKPEPNWSKGNGGLFVGVTQCPRGAAVNYDTAKNIEVGVRIFFDKIKTVERLLAANKTESNGHRLIFADDEELTILYSAVALYKGLNTKSQPYNMASNPIMQGDSKHRLAFFPALAAMTNSSMSVPKREKVAQAVADQSKSNAAYPTAVDAPALEARIVAPVASYTITPAQISLSIPEGTPIIAPYTGMPDSLGISKLKNTINAWWVPTDNPQKTLDAWGRKYNYTAITAAGGMYVLGMGWKDTPNKHKILSAFRSSLISKPPVVLLDINNLPPGVKIGGSNREIVTPKSTPAPAMVDPTVREIEEVPYSIQDAFAGRENKDGSRDIEKSMFHDHINYDRTCRLVQAFPTYYLALVDGGQRLKAYRLWDRAFGLRSAISIDVFKEKGNPVHTCVLALSDVCRNLSDEVSERRRQAESRLTKLGRLSPFRWTVFDAISVISESVNPHFGFEDMRRWSEHIDSLMVKTGTRIHLRIGFSSNANDLPVVFNGTISEAAVEEGTVQIVALGDGIELVKPLVREGKTSDQYVVMPKGGEDPGKIVRDIMLDWGKGTDYILHNYGFHVRSAYGIEHFGVPYLKITDFFNSEIKEPGMNIYSSCMDTPRIYSKTFWDKADIVGAIHWAQHTTSATLKITESTAWKVFDAAAKLTTDFVCDVHPFDFRSTVFFGKAWWPLRYGYNVELVNALKEPTDGKEDPVIKDGGSDGWIGKVTEWKPFQQIHFLSSFHNLLGNSVSTSEEEVYTNCIAYNAHSDKAPGNCMRVDPAIWSEKQKTKVVNSFSADTLTQKGANFDLDTPWLVDKVNNTCAANHLKESVTSMYTGYFVTIGSASIKPRDILTVNDSYREMGGVCEVREAHHTFSVQNGFVTLIRPSCIGTCEDMDFITSCMWAAKATVFVPAIFGSMKLNCYLLNLYAKKKYGDVIAKAIAKSAKTQGAKVLGWASKLSDKYQVSIYKRLARLESRSWYEPVMRGVGKAISLSRGTPQYLAAGADLLKTARGYKIAGFLNPLTAAEMVAIALVTNTLSEAVNRWVKSRHAVILYPLTVRGKEFSSGINGHMGAVLGDPVGTIDSVMVALTNPSDAKKYGGAKGWAAFCLAHVLNFIGVERANYGQRTSDDFFGITLDPNRVTEFQNQLDALDEGGSRVGGTSNLMDSAPVVTDKNKEPAIAAAESMLNWPYNYGGTGSKGIDCSAMLQKAFAQAGANLPRTAAAQSLVGQTISMDNLSRGDRLYFHMKGDRIDHCGIYLGGNKFIHASSNRDKVSYEDLSAHYLSKLAVIKR